MAGNFGAAVTFAGSPLTSLNPARVWPSPKLPAATPLGVALPIASPLSRRKKMAATVENGSTHVGDGPSPVLHHHASNGTSDDAVLLRVKRLSPSAVVPFRASPLSAGYDLSSAMEVTVPARGKALVPTDLSISVPQGTYARIAPRSGLAWKHSIDVGAGVVDADYRGPVGVVLFNHSDLDFVVKPSDRIAQVIIQRIVTPEVVEVEDLDSTARGAGGFGSTGV